MMLSNSGNLTAGFIVSMFEELRIFQAERLIGYRPSFFFGPGGLVVNARTFFAYSFSVVAVVLTLISSVL